MPLYYSLFEKCKHFLLVQNQNEKAPAWNSPVSNNERNYTKVRAGKNRQISEQTKNPMLSILWIGQCGGLLKDTKFQDSSPPSETQRLPTIKSEDSFPQC